MQAVLRFAVTALMLFSTALVEGHPLIGTWQLKSYVVTSAKGERSTPYGEHPSGYMTYTADGRMHVIGIADGRLAPRDAVPTDEEQIALQKTMFAYAGTYSVEAGEVIHHVELSWNQAWSGTDQARLFEVHGKTLTIITHFTDPASGAQSRYVVTWEKVEGFHRHKTGTGE